MARFRTLTVPIVRFVVEAKREPAKEELHALGRKDPIVLDWGHDRPARGYVTVDVRDNASWEATEGLRADKSPAQIVDDEGHTHQIIVTGIRSKETADVDGHRVTVATTYNWVEIETPKDSSAS